MRKTLTGNRKYPIKVTLSDGTVLKVPKQANFKNSFLRCHGCSIMAEYLALQYLHKHIWPSTLLRWHRKSDREDIKSKVTLRGVEKGINHYKPGSAFYDRTPTAMEIRRDLQSGHVVILEQQNPIHSIFLFHDKGQNYMISYGKVTRINVDRIAKTATKNSTYKGMVSIRRN